VTQKIVDEMGSIVDELVQNVIFRLLSARSLFDSGGTPHPGGMAHV
jgi:hypothetical protein